MAPEMIHGSNLPFADFMAPEMIMVPDRGRKVFRDQVPRDVREPYDESVDVWAVGVMAYELVTRNAPFTGKTEDLLIAAIQKGTYAIPPTLSRDFLDFLSRCLSLDPAQRSPARDLLRHPFLALHASERTVTRFRRAADALVDMDSALSQRTLDGVGVAEAASMRYKPPSGRSSAAGDANGGRSSVVSPTSSVVNRDALLQVRAPRRFSLSLPLQNRSPLSPGRRLGPFSLDSGLTCRGRVASYAGAFLSGGEGLLFPNADGRDRTWADQGIRAMGAANGTRTFARRVVLAWRAGGGAR